ncbi:putative phosphoesterase, PA-phosphatase related protein [Flexivirga endophytica]|uniref:Phosphoesterase, PA-phosphatase related protein n=1 Tax=Flexivirga endophytica TaxID=1849103 RepID=A0A916TFS7_9MICO|nr:phosphatase PAP2 family protein [Flexivirga endophytica]GGB43307.1 putative phosphoesterase, PA-phosphatase related protein [Flexivirga endophytica]GHB64741.1 putative phosphoesterase, PA-phosphatase related protein [Flexivirga endophytica]
MIDWLNRIMQDVDNLDVAVFEGIATTHSPILDRVMPRLSDAADHSVLWLGVAGALGLSRDRRAKRAALRGVVTIAATSLIANQVAKRTNRRIRPSLSSVPIARLSRRLPTSSSFPSGHAASAAAFATAVGLEMPVLSVPLRTLAGLVGFSRVSTGAHYPSDVAAGWLLGTAVAGVGARLVPPAEPPSAIRGTDVIRLAARPTGSGVVLVVNPASHSGEGKRVLQEVRRELPDAEVVELAEDSDVEAVMRESASRAEVLGVAGGDGTVRTAAAAAREADVPLAVFPAGTFNHFAKDAWAFPLRAAITAVKQGTAAKVDLAYLNDQLFLNTASVGAYTDFVAIRERNEKRIGKPLAALYAGARTLLRSQPITVRVDDRTAEVDLLFLGNSEYQPHGFAPSFRERLDDGLVDLRMLDASGLGATLTILASLLTGQLGRHKRYHEIHAPSLRIEVVEGGPVRIARDGELGEEAEVLDLRVDRRALTVFRHEGVY